MTRGVRFFVYLYLRHFYSLVTDFCGFLRLNGNFFLLYIDNVFFFKKPGLSGRLRGVARKKS